MQDLRIILIILGAVAIAALLIHGLWTSQKGRQKPIREKPIGKVASTGADNTSGDLDGFDRDGIGKISVAGSKRQAAPVTGEADRADDWHQTPHFSAINDDDEDEPSLGLPPQPPRSAVAANEADNSAAGTPNPAETQAQLRARQYQQGEIDPLFDEPNRDAPEPEPLSGAVESDEPRFAPQPEPAVQETPEPEPAPAPLRKVPKTWQDVYVINLVAQPNQQLTGNDLMRALTEAGFSFGDMDIFHRYQSAGAQGEPLFSLINMVKPGTFNPDAMSEFSTPGVSIFMQLPKPGMAKNQFNLMIQAAESMAEGLDGLLLDAERRPLGPDYLARCREQLRDFDSQAQ
ncbi:cell division protein ZipA [Oceanisphaera sp.]|uniref:cell division protein ZipA n=1 Tax=Oceanisphaera sp. TaxID=1929979 RepID=UPI003A951BAA